MVNNSTNINKIKSCLSPHITADNKIRTFVDGNLLPGLDQEQTGGRNKPVNWNQNYNNNQKASFSLSQMLPLNTGLTVYIYTIYIYNNWF